MYRKEPQGWLKHLDFTVLNLIALHASYCMAYFIRMGTENPYHSKLYRTIAVLLTLFQLLVTIVCHNYNGFLCHAMSSYIFLPEKRDHIAHNQIYHAI